MESQFSHLALLVADLHASRDFYISVLAPLNFVEADSEINRFVRLTNGRNLVIVLAQVEDNYRENGFHRKNIGMNHFALSVSKIEDIDAMASHLRKLEIPLLGEGLFKSTYRGGYSGLMIEDPNRIMIEIVHHQLAYFEQGG